MSAKQWESPERVDLNRTVNQANQTNVNIDVDRDEEVQIYRIGERRKSTFSSGGRPNIHTSFARQLQKGSATRKSDCDSENSDNETIAKNLKKKANDRRPTSFKRASLTEPFIDEDPRESDSGDSDNKMHAKKVKKSANYEPPTSTKKPTLAEPFSDENSDNKIKSKNKASAKKTVPPAKKGKPIATNAEEENEDEEYEVEDIVDHCVNGRRKYYKIRWKGYGHDSDTWEEEKSIYATDLIVKYHESHPNDQPNQLKKKTDKRKKKKIVVAPRRKTKIDQMPDYKETTTDAEVVNWDVEKIIDVHYCEDNTREFLIRWKDYSSNADTWEPESNLDCKEMIEIFMAKVDRVASVSQRELRVAPAQTKRYTLVE